MLRGDNLEAVGAGSGDHWTVGGEGLTEVALRPGRLEHHPVTAGCCEGACGRFWVLDDAGAEVQANCCWWTNRQPWATLTGLAINRGKATSPFLLPPSSLCCCQLAGLAERQAATKSGNYSFQSSKPSVTGQSVKGESLEPRGDR